MLRRSGMQQHVHERLRLSDLPSRWTAPGRSTASWWKMGPVSAVTDLASAVADLACRPEQPGAQQAGSLKPRGERRRGL